MDELDLVSQPSLSSSLDDTFYILKKTLYRLLSTASIETLAMMCKEVRQIIERDVADVWRGRMDGAFKDVAAGGGVGRAREEEKDKREREAKAMFIVRRLLSVSLRTFYPSLVADLPQQPRYGGGIHGEADRRDARGRGAASSLLS